MASKINNVRMPPTRKRLNMITMTSERKVTARYIHDCIQKTGIASSRSRSVPPPIAVTRPTT